MFDTPDAAFRTAVAAVNAGDWHGVAMACDPASLVAFKRQLLEQVEPAEPVRTLTLEQFTRHDPGMPPAVAEYQYAQYQAAVDPQDQLRQELPTVRDVAELRRLEPAEVFAAWLEGRSPKYMIERLARDRHIGPATVRETLEQLPPSLDYDPIGAVPDGDRVAHVLYHRMSRMPDGWEDALPRWLVRVSAEEQALAKDLANREHPSVATCRRQPDGTWRLVAGRGFLSLDSFAIALAGESPDAHSDEAG